MGMCACVMYVCVDAECVYKVCFRMCVVRYRTVLGSCAFPSSKGLPERFCVVLNVKCVQDFICPIVGSVITFKDYIITMLSDYVRFYNGNI